MRFCKLPLDIFQTTQATMKHKIVVQNISRRLMVYSHCLSPGHRNPGTGKNGLYDTMQNGTRLSPIVLVPVPVLAPIPE